MSKHRWRGVSLIFITLLGLVLVWIEYGLWQTQHALTALKNLELQTAAQAATRAHPVAASLNAITLKQVPDLQIWQQVLELAQATPTIATTIQSTLTSPTAQPPDWTSLAQAANRIETKLPQTWLLQRLYPEETATLSTALQDFQVFYQAALTGNRTFLIVFQNSHELRATGGFVGSYALAKLSNGQLESLVVQDIYVPDGQFTGFIPAPAGVSEYLSSGHGLRLPDANWSPDFPTSAQQILSYFALGKESQIDGVVAVNLELAGSVLDIFGEVFVPDYQLTVTSHNLADALRTGRDGFFPGSIQKQHILGSVVNQLKFKLTEATPTQQQQLFNLLETAVAHKQLQVYVHDQNLEQVLVKSGAAGQVTPTGTFFWFPVESNVGINKANPGVSREVTLTLGETQSAAEILFTNTNHIPDVISTTSASPHYANYQRLFLLPDTQISSISVDGHVLSEWDESLETTAAGENVKQIGWLITVPAQTQRRVELKLQHPPLGTNPTVMIQKQSGLPPTSYDVTFADQRQQLDLTQDTQLKF